MTTSANPEILTFPPDPIEAIDGSIAGQLDGYPTLWGTLAAGTTLQALNPEHRLIIAHSGSAVLQTLKLKEQGYGSHGYSPGCAFHLPVNEIFELTAATETEQFFEPFGDLRYTCFFPKVREDYATISGIIRSHNLGDGYIPGYSPTAPWWKYSSLD